MLSDLNSECVSTNPNIFTTNKQKKQPEQCMIKINWMSFSRGTAVSHPVSDFIFRVKVGLSVAVVLLPSVHDK